MVTVKAGAGGRQQTGQQYSKQRRRMSSPFLKMPAELRNMVYRQAFSGLRLFVRQAHRETTELRACFEQSGRGLLRTSKQVRMESLLFLYHDLTISSTYRPHRKDSQARGGFQFTEFPFFSKRAMAALQQARAITIERELFMCYDSFGSMFKHCSPRLQEIELCIVSAKEYSQDLGHDRTPEFQQVLDEACQTDIQKLLVECREKIVENVRGHHHAWAEREEAKKTDEGENVTEDGEGGEKGVQGNGGAENQETKDGLAVERMCVKTVDMLSCRGMIGFKTQNRFRIRLEGASA